MSGLSSYILSIAGIIFVSIIVELVISDGTLSKHIKSIFSFFILAVIIAPLPALVSNENVSSVFEFSEYEIQEGYIYTLNKSRLETMATEEELLLQNEGYKNIKIVFHSSNMSQADMKIDGASINLAKMIVLEEAKHKEEKDIKEHITSRMIERYDIEKGGIVYER